jgi:hypothetical protein
LATSDSAGAVEAAVYAKPHFIDEENVPYHGDKLTHNIQQNPRAAYLFKEPAKSMENACTGHTREVKDPQAVAEMRRKKYPRWPASTATRTSSSFTSRSKRSSADRDKE